MKLVSLFVISLKGAVSKNLLMTLQVRTYCGLWKEVTMHSLHLKNESYGPFPTEGRVSTLFGILKHIFNCETLKTTW